jgi:mRNA interferase RelE/StbE
MGSYNLCFNTSVKKELRQVSKPYLQKIMDKICSLREDPRPFGVKLLRGENRYYRIRQGDYRIVYDIDDETMMVTVVAVGHRREVYDN